MAPRLLAKANHGSSYIVSLASTSSTSCAALATRTSTENDILFYTLSPTGFSLSRSLHLQDDPNPTSLRAIHNAPGAYGQPIYMTAHKNPGCVKAWDERQARPSITIHPPGNRSILSFDLSSNILAAGTDLLSEDASIFYWDMRKTATPLHVHSSTHSDDITAIHFHPNSSHTLLSASTDGLLSLSQTDQADEDEAVTHVENWGCSIARAGWLSLNDGQYAIWAGSDMETFSTWSQELDSLVNFGDIREISIPGQKDINYLIDAFDYSQDSGPYGITSPMLYFGSNHGDVTLVTISDLASREKTLQLKETLANGHSDTVVRCVLYNKTNELLLTGDEEGRLNAWKIPSTAVDDDGDFKMDEEISSSRLKRPREEDESEVRYLSISRPVGVCLLRQKITKRGRFIG